MRRILPLSLSPCTLGTLGRPAKWSLSRASSLCWTPVLVLFLLALVSCVMPLPLRLGGRTLPLPSADEIDFALLASFSRHGAPTWRSFTVSSFTSVAAIVDEVTPPFPTEPAALLPPLLLHLSAEEEEEEEEALLLESLL